MNEQERTQIELTRRLAELIRHLSTLEAELHSLDSALRRPEGEDSSSLLKTLDAMRGSEQYQNILAQYEPLIARLEKTASEREKNALMQSAPMSERVQ